MNTSMNFSLFTASVVNGLQKKMGDSCRVFSDLIKKNNGVELTGIILKEKNCNTSPTIYIDDFYDDYQNGVSIEEIIEAVYGLADKSRFTRSVDLSDFISYEKAAKQIAFKLINYEKNRELLKDIPHKIFLNLAIVYYYVVQEPPFYGKASILIQNSHLQIWGISAEELYRNAMVNTPVMLPAQIDNIEDVMMGMLMLEGNGDKWADSVLTKLQEDLKEESRIPMYVLSNDKKLQGAACMLYPDILKNFANEKKCDLFILPSSVHEVILLPDSKDMSKESLIEMVSEINKTQVENCEILADSVYYYSQFESKITHIG